MQSPSPDSSRSNVQTPSYRASDSAVRFGRRAFLLGGVFAVQSIMVAATTLSDRARTFFRHFNPANPISNQSFYELVSSYTETPIEVTSLETAEDGTRTYRIALAQPGSVFLTAAAAGNRPMFVHPLIVQVEDGPRLLLPLIRSDDAAREIPSTIQLGWLDAGEHTFTLVQHPSATLPIPDSLVLRAARPDPDALLAKFLATMPIIELKNPANPLDDIPLMTFARVYRRGERYKVTSFIIFSSENGGTMPARLLAQYQRTVDIEWMTQQIFTVHGEPVDGELSFQAVRHTFVKFEGRRMLGDHPLLWIASQNNNFSDGNVRVFGIPVPRLRFPEAVEPIYYLPKPRFVPGLDFGTLLLADYPELQRWSLFELTMEGCVLDNGRIDPGEAQFYADLEEIRRYLTVSFPDRGCRRLLSVETGGQ